MSSVTAVLVLTFSLLCNASFASDTSGAFDSANKLYGQGKFAEAAGAYEKLIQTGTVSSAIYFNLGNAYFKSGQLGRAVAAYRDAELISPRDPEVRANLQFVRGQVQGATLSSTTMQRWLASLTVNEWTKLTAAVLWLWLSLFVLIQWKPAWRQPLRAFLWSGGLVTVALAGLLAMACTNNSTKSAIIVSHEVLIHNGPLDEAPGNVTIHDGAEASVVDTKNDWLQIRLDGNRIGWVRRDQVMLASGV
jgi:tetratricopeptide (TPR) repeat protein